MRGKLQTGVLPMILMVCFSSANALEPDACQERLKFVDERIASGKYPDQNVQMAKQMRDSIVQSCAYLTDATITPMLEGFEQLLPTRSDAERQAYEDTRRAERAEQREVQRAESEVRREERVERERMEAANKPEPLPVSEVLKRPPTAKSVLAKTIDRDDGMYYAEPQDWDVFQGNLRILYSTAPSREQFVADTAQHHLYVIEADANGVVAQRRVMDMPIQRVMAAGLRRGHDEVFLQQFPPNPDRPQQLERWSISDRRLLSSVTAPTLPGVSEYYFCLATSDGNVLYAAGPPGPRGPTTIEWLKVSPDGKVVGHGRISSETSSYRKSSQCFGTSNGGGGFVVEESSYDEDGIDTAVDTPIKRRVGDAELEAVITSEQRLLVTNNGGESVWQSGAISRQLAWQGHEGLGPMVSPSTQQELERVTGDIEYRYSGNRSIVNRDTGTGGRRSAAQAVGDGYGVLIDGRSLGYGHSGAKGSWFYEYSADGDSRETNLGPTREHLGVGFSMFAAPNEDSVTLFAAPYVILLDENREVTAYGTTSSGDMMYAGGMIADESGAWIFGQLDRSEPIQRLRLERIEF